MIGSAYKKLAAEYNMKIASGVAYGNLRGYAATLSEGAGWKQLAFSTSFSDPAQKGLFIEAVNAENTEKLYRVRSLRVAPRSITVEFLDNPGTMKKIGAFLDWFVPLLDQYSATKADICSECGMQITGSCCWKLIDGVAHCMHDSCGERARDKVASENENRRQEAEGSYGLGLIGALLGSAVGAVLWAIVLNLGYVASVVGLVIGFLAEKGYNLLHGKQGKAKVAILIVAVIVGVLLGTFGAEAYTLVTMINAGEIDITYGQIPECLWLFMEAVPEYASAVTSNILMGLLFAGLGVFALLRKASKEVADKKFVDLK